MIKVYIASPYTKGDIAQNVKRQMDVADELMNAGFYPYIPLLTHFQHMIHPRPWGDWMKFDQEWVLSCNVVLRLPGESVGADREVELADRTGIPVFHSIDALVKAMGAV